MQVVAHIINAFAHNNQGGNPAGVVLNANDLSTKDKQAIAAKMGMSETAFVSNSSTADFKLDFFTPAKQIPHCGHATIATFSYLKQTGVITSNNSSKETIDGIRSIYFEGDSAYMQQGAPTFFVPTDDIENILSCLAIEKEQLLENQQPTIVNTGNSFLLIPLKSEETLRSVNANLDEISRLSEKYGLVGFYLFTTNVKDTGFDATTRMFAPFYGITEESATGMAAGPLACYLYEHGIGKTNINIQQGKFMTPPSPSLLNVILHVSDKMISNLYAGGKAFYVTNKTVEI